MALIGTNFDDAFAAEAEADITQLGPETILYSADGAADVSIEALVPREKLTTLREAIDRGTSGTRVIEGVVMLLADAPTPSLGDKITFDPNEREGASPVAWALTSIDSTHGGLAIVTAEAQTDEEVSTPSHRRTN